MQVQLATVTQKGQVTLSANLRSYLGIKPYSRVKIFPVINAETRSIQIEPELDILDIAPIGKAPKGMNALKAREYMQTHYKRI